MGAGLENLLQAVQASVSLDPVSVAFGGIPSGSGSEPLGVKSLKNLTESTATFEFLHEDPFRWRRVYPSSRLRHARTRCDDDDTRDGRCPDGIPATGHWAWLLVSTGGSEVAPAALYTRLSSSSL